MDKRVIGGAQFMGGSNSLAEVCKGFRIYDLRA